MSVTKTLRKKFYSFEQEEQWLNELADYGWRLIHFGNGETDLAYTFELDPTVKGQRYKIDYRIMKDKAEFGDYITLFEEAGWLSVPSRWNNYKYIFISTEAKDIYSDTLSLIERERQRRKMHLISLNIGLVAVITSLVWYYFKGLDFLPVLIFLYSVATAYYGWLVWKKTKKMKQLRG